MAGFKRSAVLTLMPQELDILASGRSIEVKVDNEVLTIIIGRATATIGDADQFGGFRVREPVAPAIPRRWG